MNTKKENGARESTKIKETKNFGARETTKIKDLKHAQMCKLLELGELKTENILEIQMLEALIKNSDMTEEQIKGMGKCLEMLINCSNAYIRGIKENIKEI